jgi:hypothetical protein
MSSRHKRWIGNSDRTPSRWNSFQKKAMRDQRALWGRDRNEQRIARWIERQNQKQDWVCLADVAAHYARKPDIIEHDERRLVSAYSELQDSILRDEFLVQGRWRIIYLPLCVGMGFPDAKPNHKTVVISKQPTFIGRGSWPDLSSPLRAPKLRLNEKQFREWFASGRVLSSVLAACWMPRDLCLCWFNARKLNPPPWLVGATPKPHAADSSKSKLPSKISDENGAVIALTPRLEEFNDLKFKDAETSLENFKLSKRGFRYRVWPKAREAAGLPPTASAGRKRKT